jgi:hypothetical protein
MSDASGTTRPWRAEVGMRHSDEADTQVRFGHLLGREGDRESAVNADFRGPENN